MTYKRISLLLSCFILKQGLVAQIVPPPATQTEVDAGVNKFKYVTPFTLANSPLAGGPTNGVSATAATNIATAVAASKQQGSFLLTNFSAMGITNIVSANENTVVTTNSGVLVFTSISNYIPFNADGLVFYEDFKTTGPLNSTQWLQRKSPSGHSYTVYGNPADTTTNGFLVENGWWKQTNLVVGALYLGVTNNGPQPWTRFGGVFRWVSNAPPVGPLYSQPSILNHEFPRFAGSAKDYFHATIDASGYVRVQRGVAGYGSFDDVLMDTGADANIKNRDYVVWDNYVFTNCVMTVVNGYLISAVATNYMESALNRGFIFENLGTFTNTYDVQWKYAWAGYAPPAITLLANRIGTFGTNGTLLKRSTPIALTAGNYTMNAIDEIIGVPNGATRTVTLMPILTKLVGKEITIYDEGQTASGTNITILTTGTDKINGGPTQTNLTTDGGSITLYSTRNGWRLKSTPSSGGGGSTSPGGSTPTLQMNMGGAFVGTTNLVYDVTNSRVGLNIGANRPNAALEIGGSGSIGSGIRVGSSTTSNTNFFDGGGLGMAGDYSMRIYMNSGIAWYLDNSISPYAIHPATTNLADLGTYLLPVRTNWSTWSVVKDTLTAGSIVTVSSTSGLLAMQSATSGKVLALSVPDTLAAASTNLFSFTSPVAGQTFKLLSTSNGVNTWTNAPFPITIGIQADTAAHATNNVYYAGGGGNTPIASISSATANIRTIRAPRSGVINNAWLQITSTDTGGNAYGSAETLTMLITNITAGTSGLIGTIGISNQVRMVSTTTLGLNVSSNDSIAAMLIMPIVMTNAPGSGWQWQGSLSLQP